jgi:hypothetical protein
MAARRLLILMLVLLGVSTLAAALVPPQGEEQRATSTDTKTGRPTKAGEDRGPPGRLIKRTIRVAPHGADTVRIHRDDQLALTVRSGVADQVEIPAFGQLEDLTPEAPARFNLLPDRTGTFAVRLLAAGRVIGRIEVKPPEPRQRGQDRGKRQA